MGSIEGTGLEGSTDTRNTSRMISIAAALAGCGFIVLAIARIVAGEPGFMSTLVIGGVISLLTIWVNLRVLY